MFKVKGTCCGVLIDIFITGCDDEDGYDRSFSYDASADSCEVTAPPEHLQLDRLYR